LSKNKKRDKAFTPKRGDFLGCSKSQRNLRELVLEVVDETLKRFLGETVISIIYGYLEMKYNLKREEIPEKPEAFSKSLREIFGSGAITIEESILKNLFSKLKLEYKEREELTFTEVVKRFSEPSANQS